MEWDLDKKFKVFVSAALILLTLIIVAGGITLFFLIGNNQKAGSGMDKVQNESLEIVYLDEPINSNLKIDKDGIPHIIRISVGFEIDSKDKDYKTFMKEFTEKQIIIRDTIISVLRSETYNTINKETLSNKIKEQINTLLKTEIITKIYFSDFFVQ